MIALIMVCIYLKHVYVWMFIVSFNLSVVCSLYSFNKINSLGFPRDRVHQPINDLAALIVFFLYVFGRLRIKIS